MPALFAVPVRAGKAADSAIAKKSNSRSASSSTTVKGGGGLAERINTARAIVEKNLGQYRDDYVIIQDEDELDRYIQKSIQNRIIAIDTETTGLDPMLDKIVGISICTRREKAAYIPINHKSYVTGMHIENQLPANTIGKIFSKLSKANLGPYAKEMEIVMFNAAFDMRVLRHGVGAYIVCTWDCYLGARLLNENEGSGNNNLKALYRKYCTDGEGTATRFADIFEGISFDLVPINLGYIYAGHDAKMTLDLYDFQLPFLTADNDVCIDHGLQDVAWVFHNIEMPCVEVVADMEDTGVKFDFDYNAVLKNEYHKKLDEQQAEVYKIVDMYEDEISAYRAKNPSVKLDTPINIGSTSQLAILLYDIMKVKPVIDRKTKKESRSTSEAILTQLKNPLCDAILKFRSLSVLVSTFIDKLPECVNPNDGRIHCKFNQYGADTGRFSSSDPNLQNIPSHNKDIRKMFVASSGYVLMSSDFSQQEPKCLAALCRKQGDAQMYNVFMEGKDLYSEIASKAFNKPYEECKEFRPDGTVNKEGKERRTQAKSILLGRPEVMPL